MKDFVNCLLLLFLITSSAFSASAQKEAKAGKAIVPASNNPAASKFVKTSNGVLIMIPVENRDRLITRLSDYIENLNKNNAANLYDLITERKKQGLSKEEFFKAVKIQSEGDVITFFITQPVKKADADDYIDETKPTMAEGDKWFVRGCAKLRDLTGKLRYYEADYDVWLTNNEWFINRHGFRLEYNNYLHCKFTMPKS